MAETLSLPGFVDAHCHAFQRGLRGRTGGADFWAWRELMLAEAELQTPAIDNIDSTKAINKIEPASRGQP